MMNYYVDQAGRYVGKTNYPLPTYKLVDEPPPRPDMVYIDGIWSDRELAPEERQALSEEAARLLSESDWRVTKAMETGEAMSDAWSLYRQQLRAVARGDVDVLPDKPE
ncbi:MAG: phage tail assembly chaperone [Pseudomonadota bacterium]